MSRAKAEAYTSYYAGQKQAVIFAMEDI